MNKQKIMIAVGLVIIIGVSGGLYLKYSNNDSKVPKSVVDDSNKVDDSSKDKSVKDNLSNSTTGTTNNTEAENQNKPVSDSKNNPKVTTDKPVVNNQDKPSVDKNKSNLNVKAKYAQEVKSVDAESDKLEAEYNTKEGLTQNGMNMISFDQANLYDIELNKIYQYLMNNLDSDKAAKLKEDEILWIQQKEQKISNIRKDHEGGSVVPFLVNKEVMSLSRERCNYLINTYMH